MERTSWTNTWMAVAFAVAGRSRCTRRQVGVVIISPEQRVVSVGYNGPPASWGPATGSPNVRAMGANVTCEAFCERALTGGSATSYDDCPSLHGEQNALVWASGKDVKGATMFIAGGAPCFTCAKLVAGAGVATVVHVKNDAADRDRNPSAAFTFLEQCGVTCVEWTP